MRPGLVVGARGQDGRILSAQLLAVGRPVLGLDLGSATLRAPSAAPRSEEPLDLLDGAAVRERVRAVQPWAIFYLAAFHHSAEDKREDDRVLFAKSTEVHLDAAVQLLDAMRAGCSDARFFYAASSHVFGTPATEPQNEETPFRPNSIYAITKAAGVNVTAYYRKSHGLHASSGILYNHESQLRAEKFLTRRVILGARAARAAREKGERYVLELGSLSDTVDWTWAPDTTDAMQRIVEAREAGDFVVASGEAHSVAELCRLAFARHGLDSAEHVREAPGRLTRPSVRLVGDSRRLREATGWKPTLSFEQLVARLDEEPPPEW